MQSAISTIRSSIYEYPSDEDYLVLRAREAQVKDVFTAKSWLITAKTLFPTNFGVQFEAYCMEKAQRHVLEGARQLESLLYNFMGEAVVWAEVRAITDALRSESLDELSVFMRDVFSRLPVEMQRHLLIKAAERCDDIVDHCRLLIVLLQRFPDSVAQQGMTLVETLLSAEKHNNISSPVNSFRKLLVCDIVPLILNAPAHSMEIPHKQLYRLLHKCLEFCVGRVTQFYFKDTNSPHSSMESEGLPSSPWQQVAVVMESIGHKLGWELWDNFFTSNRESQWQRLQSTYQLKITNMEEPMSPSFRQVLYCTTVIFLHCLYDYAMAIYPEPGSGGDNPKIPVVLVEGFHGNETQTTFERSFIKKLKLETSDVGCPTVSIDKAALPTAGNVNQNFLTALRCWDLVHGSEHLTAEFERLCQQLHVDKWVRLMSFNADALMYKGLYQEAIHSLHGLNQLSNPWIKETTSIRLASCYFHLGEYSRACQQVVELAQSLKHLLVPPKTESLNSLVKPNRHFIFLQFNCSAVLSYCVKLLITCLEKVLQSTEQNDQALGHLLVLLQYNWPQEELLFSSLVQHIQQIGSFTYNLFFNYITNIDILEEFAFLSTPNGGNVTLDVLPVSTGQIAKQRTITRGVNKGAKEDFRLATEKQIGRSTENLDTLLINFIIEEHSSLNLQIQIL